MKPIPYTVFVNNSTKELMGRRNQSKQQHQPLYGDIVGCILGTAASLFYAFETYFVLKSSKDESIKRLAVTFLVLHTLPLFFYYPSALSGNLWCSRMGMLAVVFMMAYSSMVQ